MTQTVRAAIVGMGNMARYHLPAMFALNTEIPVISEPSALNVKLANQKFEEIGVNPPVNEPDLPKMLDKYADSLDAVFIITPHAFHHDQTTACMESGLDVLLEKPMVMNAEEARSLIATRDRTGRLLVVAFQGGLSPNVRHAVKMIQSGELGEILTISGTVWQNWKQLSAGKWRTQPEISGGGFLFDTGAHMLNTVCELAGEDFAEVGAWLDNRGMDVDILGAVMGRLYSGALVTINACGDTITSCASEIRVHGTKAILKTGVWGEFLLVQREGESDFSEVETPTMSGAWEQFLRVRRGEMGNPSPPEVGLRMAKLWDAIQASAKQNGIPVQCH